MLLAGRDQCDANGRVLLQSAFRFNLLQSLSLQNLSIAECGRAGPQVRGSYSIVSE
jgi:hypothetical protein